MKTGCGKSVTKGHGDVAVCGKDFYGEIYTCDSCLKLRVAELKAVLREALCAIEELECHDLYITGKTIKKIYEVLK